MSTALTSLQILALSKALTDSVVDKARAQVAPGEYVVDFKAAVTVALKVGEDYEQEIVLKADPWTLLLAALSHLNGVTIDSLAREALAADPALVASIKEEAKTAMAAINATTLTACKGKVTVPRRLVEVFDAGQDAAAEVIGAIVEAKAPATGLAAVFEE